MKTQLLFDGFLGEGSQECHNLMISVFLMLYMVQALPVVFYADFKLSYLLFFSAACVCVC